VLSLQHAIGNRAVSGLMRTATLSRCPGGCRCGGKCGGHEEELFEEHEQALRRRAGSPQATLQRRAWTDPPPYKPDPRQKPGAGNPPPDCTPFPVFWGRSPDAGAAWSKWRYIAPDKLRERCGCAAVGDAYARYMDGAGGKLTYSDDGNCISAQCAAEDSAHKKLEEKILTQWHNNRDLVSAALGEGKSAEIDLVEAAKTSGAAAVAVGAGSLSTLDVSTEITYRDNAKAGGLLFGGGSPPGGPPDSDFGRDTRRLTGTIKLERVDDGSNPNVLDVKETITFKYAVDDALDFCPGNTWRHKWDSQEHIAYNLLLSDLSRLEASGMTKDVGFHVEYHRTHTEQRSVNKPPPPAPIELNPTSSGVVTGDFLRHRRGPGTGSLTVGLFPRGTELHFDCFTKGTMVGTDDRWCHLPTTDTWVSHAYIQDVGGHELPEC
jgi:hypothetical protein